MAKTLKQLLLAIAHLPSSDQRWILRQLQKTQPDALKSWQGLQLLEEAQRFRGLKNTPLLSTPEPQKLPSYCEHLASQTPLYVSIILEQGSFDWKKPFLQQFDKDGAIESLIANQVADIKLATKQWLFKEWESSPTFEEYMESHCG